MSLPEVIVESTKKNIILDATVLTSLMACPCMVDLRFNRHFQSLQGKSNSLECGSIVHKVQEVFYQELIKGFPRKTAIASAMTAGVMYIQGCRHCRDFVPASPCPACENSLEDKICPVCNNRMPIVVPSCGHYPNEYPGVVNTPAENQTKPKRIGYKWVMETMDQYFDRWKNEAWVPLESERVRSKILYEDDNIRILWKAKLDTIVDTLNGIYPCDHKTMQQNRSIVSINNQFKGQCLVADTRAVIINKIGFQKSLKPEEKFIRTMVSYSAEILLEWQSITLPHYAYEFLMYHETGYWPPRSTHCENKFGRCQFISVCEANPDMRGEELRKGFMVGEPWDPINIDTVSNDD